MKTGLDVDHLEMRNGRTLPRSPKQARRAAVMAGEAVDPVVAVTTYSYEEESEESEEQVEDPSVRGSQAGSARSRRSQPGSARSGRGTAQGSEASTAQTTEIREMLQTAARKQIPERAKPVLSQVKIEAFRGNREKYHDWKKLFDAQRALHRLEDSEMALLIYLNSAVKARLARC